jgi:hypothetical protein
LAVTGTALDARTNLHGGLLLSVLRTDTLQSKLQRGVVCSSSWWFSVGLLLSKYRALESLARWRGRYAGQSQNR